MIGGRRVVPQKAVTGNVFNFDSSDYIKSSRKQARQGSQLEQVLSSPLLSFSGCLKMKIQAVVVLSAVLILTILVAECELIRPPIPGKI